MSILKLNLIITMIKCIYRNILRDIQFLLWFLCFPFFIGCQFNVEVQKDPLRAQQSSDSTAETVTDPQVDSGTPSSEGGNSINLVALLSGLPPNPSNGLNLNISVSGTEITSYQFKIGPSASTYCDLITGYSSDLPVSSNLIENLSSYLDGELKVCVIGKSSNGNTQSLNEATSYTWIKDTVTPVITSVNSSTANGIYTIGSKISISIQFSKVVSLSSTGTPTLDLNSNSTAKALYISGSGSNTLNFEYTISATDVASDLNYVSVNALNLMGNTLQDSLGTAANINLPNISGPSSLGTLKNLVIDTIAPTASSFISDGIWSTLKNQSPAITFTNGLDLESGIARHEIKIIDQAGNDVTLFTQFVSGDLVTGLTLSDGETYRVVSRAIDNAGNISNLTISDGWTVDSVSPTAPSSVTVGSVPSLFKQQTPQFTFTDSVDIHSGLSHYQMEIRKYSDSSIVKSFTNIYGNGTSGLSHDEGTNILTAGEAYFVNIRAVDGAGNSSTTVSSGVWVALSCPNNYALVPPLAPYTALGFCVSRFEMKLEYDGNIVADGNNSTIYNYHTDYNTPSERAKYKAVAAPEGRPWVSLARGGFDDGATYRGAIEACNDLGSGYELISNAQWQTIARQMEREDVNWTSGTMGIELMYQGHSDNNPASSLSVNNLLDPYDQTGNSFSDGLITGREQRRTMTLPNNEVIWDFNSNVYEWVQDNSATNFGANGFIHSLSDSSHPTIATVGGLTGTAKFHFGPQGDYSSASGLHNYAGLGYRYLNPNGSILMRGGGYWGLGWLAGVFYIDVRFNTNDGSTHIGFRCTYK